jgi:hypothetical protein
MPVHSGTAPCGAAPYTSDMQIDPIKATVAMVWPLAVGAAGLVGNVNTLSGWGVLAGVALLPPLVVIWRGNGADRTMSESIREALR